jgi:hypothetical protein
MNPYLNQQIVTQRVRELHAQAARSRLNEQAQHRRTGQACAQASPRRPGPRSAPRGRVRHRAGFALVEIGLRLAGSSSDG